MVTKIKCILLLITAVIIISGCKNGSSDRVPIYYPGKKHSIVVMPLGNMDKKLVTQLRDAWQKKLNASFVIAAETTLPSSAFYVPRQRYIADSLLDFLSRVNDRRHDRIIGITTKDISTRNGEIANWGILGLGNCPGEACVISTFRAGKNKVKSSHFLQRMTNLGLHELGHTYGLEHCPVDTCLMKDAEGKMKLDDGNNYCNECRRILSRIGILN